MLTKTLIARIKSSFAECCDKRLKSNDWMCDYSHYENFVSFLKDNGFECLGSGASRRAYGNGTIVVKLGRKSENLCEIRNIKKLRTDPVLKYAVLPVLAHVTHRHEGVRLSALITMQAKPLESTGRNGAYFPGITGDGEDRPRRMKEKKYHKQWQAMQALFSDCHYKNVAQFGDAVVMIDVNFGIHEGGLREKAAAWAAPIDLDKHVKEYMAAVKQATAVPPKKKKKTKKKT